MPLKIYINIKHDIYFKGLVKLKGDDAEMEYLLR